MRTLKLTIAYEGTRYAGWQVQRVGDRHSRPTVQGTLERVFQRILQEPVKVIGSGRTDAGVHALAQVAHLKTASLVSCERLQRSANQLLPPDMAMTRLEEAPAMFHARFQAVSKWYRYRLATTHPVLPFVRRYVTPIGSPVNLALMRREAAALKGRHDFRAFARLPRQRARRSLEASVERTTIRTLTVVRLRRFGAELWIDLEGDGFLHTMARSIVGTLLAIGRGQVSAGTIRRMLVSRDRMLAGPTAPAGGLTLMAVRYHGSRVPSPRVHPAMAPRALHAHALVDARRRLA